MASALGGFHLRGHALVVLVVAVLSLAHRSMGARRLMELYEPDPSEQLTYHNGTVLGGDIPVCVLWYGRFTAAQKAIVSDFIASLAAAPGDYPVPSVPQWWSSIDRLYLAKAEAAGKKARVILSGQVSDEGCSLGRSLTLSQLPALAAAAKPAKGGVALVLTAQDVAVEGFCMSRMLAGAVTDPFGDGFYQGEHEAPLEAATACPGVYGNGAYPGNAGELLVDKATGASYNANGAHGRRYLLPALYDPASSECATLV
uniref:Uncharacterized protein n=1 Tax=Aegilops tauschii TaxID=37682 RepID=M8BI68_AEGTA